MTDEQLQAINDAVDWVDSPKASVSAMEHIKALISIIVAQSGKLLAILELYENETFHCGCTDINCDREGVPTDLIAEALGIKHEF